MREKIIQELEDLLKSDKYKERISYSLSSVPTGLIDKYATTTQSTGGKIEIKTKYFELSTDKISLIISLLKNV